MTRGRNGARQQADEFVPLSERVVVLQIFRAALAIGVALMQTILNHDASVLDQWLLVVGYLLLTTILSAPVVTANRALTLRTFGLALIVDGIFLQVQFVIGTPLGLEVLFCTYLVGVCLLASFRTGLRVALWNSLLILILREAVELGSLDRPNYFLIEQTHLVAFLGAIWFTVITTAQFAALSERELRRRRYDAEAFQRFAIHLADLRTPAEVRDLTVEFLAQELDVRRCLWIEVDHTGYRLLSGRGHAQNAPTTAPPGACTLVGAAPTAAPARTAHRLGEEDAWLSELLPDARRLIALPMPTPEAARADWMVCELPGRGSRLERRIVSGLSQTCAAAGLACSRTVALERLLAMAATDALTGSANRRSLDQTLGQLPHEGNQLPVSALLIDIDFFKQVNDLNGHQVGDEVLQSVAQALERCARRTDLVARYGGEEFAVLLSRTSTEEAVAVAERMRSRVQAEAGPVPVTVSIGVAPGVQRIEEIAGLMARADAALYRAKRSGRNQVAVYTPEHDGATTSIVAAKSDR